MLFLFLVVIVFITIIVVVTLIGILVCLSFCCFFHVLLLFTSFPQRLRNIVHLWICSLGRGSQGRLWVTMRHCYSELWTIKAY